jgi:CRP-like cAMP-binding protein
MQRTFAPRFAYRSPSISPKMSSAKGHAELAREALIAKFGQLTDLADGDPTLIGSGLHENVRLVPPRTNLIVEGTVPLRSFLVLDGWARQTKTLSDGRAQIQALLLAGDLQDLDIFSQVPIDYSLTALTPMAVVELRRDRLRFLAEQSLPLVRALWSNSLAVTAIAREWAINLGQRTAIERLAHFFCEISYRLGGAGGTPVLHFAMPLTQSDLAEATGLTSVHVNRTLQTLRSQSLICLAHRHLSILNLEKLIEIAMFEPAYLKNGARHIRDYRLSSDDTGLMQDHM